MNKKNKKAYIAALTAAFCLFSCIFCGAEDGFAATGGKLQGSADAAAETKTIAGAGGGYAASGQIPGAWYTCQVYDASSGLTTSDSMFLMGASDGHIWIGSYSGVIRYDGSSFEKMDTSEGLTSSRGFFEDSKGRIWVATNDNGVVMLDGEERTHFTYLDGLPSSSIRIFEEDSEGRIFIGTTSGVCCVDENLQIKLVFGGSINLIDERILRLSADSEGIIYGQTANGIIFEIKNGRFSRTYRSADLGLDKITSLLADPENPGKVYLGTENGDIFYGDFGAGAGSLKRISAAPLSDIHWLSYDCGRVWASSSSMLGYVDEKSVFHALEDLPVTSGIEMQTSDYQGNIWVSSSTRGVMKIVTTNFVDVSGNAGMGEMVANAACKRDGELYIGTDKGVRVLGRDGREVKNALTNYMDGIRIRCIKKDPNGNLWVAGYTGEKGLVCYSSSGQISSLTMKNGMPSNKIRGILCAKSGDLLVGTDGGLAIIRRGKVAQVAGAAQGIKNTILLAVAERGDGASLVGTDGGGIYIINGASVQRLGRSEGLTSDVVMRLVYDESNGVFWIVTSNSIEYLKDGKIVPVTTFPYNNNYDMYFDKNGNAWVLSSRGIFVVNTKEMLADDVKSYRLYGMGSGLPYNPTGNGYSELDEEGNLYVSGRSGVFCVNIDNFAESNEKNKVRMAVKAIYSGDEKILPNKDGVYTLPPTGGRIRFLASVMDYSLSDPNVRISLKGSNEESLVAKKSELAPLEYTGLPYGDYEFSVQVLDDTGRKVLQEEVFQVVKEPQIRELLIFRILLLVVVMLGAGALVWHVMRQTVIRRQYGEIEKARDEAERANAAKSRFLANISHEIRTPINTIIGMDEMILRENAHGVPKGYFLSIVNYGLDIKNASEMLLNLINDLLDISKIESGKMHLVEQEYDVQEMLRQIVSMIRVRSTDKGLFFDVNVDEMMPKRLYGDVGKIKQIVLNLLTNAVKYTEKGGFALDVQMEEREDDTCIVRFSVKDTGIGVKEENLEKLFTAYERLDEERNSNIQGTGLGLDISRRFAGLMQGRLWCESVYGEGSEFILTVPQKIVDVTPLGAFSEEVDESAAGPYLPKFVAPDADVLVVDDNPMNLNVFKGLLKATGVFVVTALSGEDALEKIRETKFDVVFLDHMMPGMDGIETMAHIREFDEDLPVYALTANTMVGEEFYCSKGFNGYLPKPVDGKELEKTIMKHLSPERMQVAELQDAGPQDDTLTADMSWIEEVEGISAEDGLKNSGGAENFLMALSMFEETIDENSNLLETTQANGDIRLFTIKVHSLKSSARIVGALQLSEMAAALEEAGNRGDRAYIDEHTGRLLEEYRAFKDKLADLGTSQPAADEEGKEEISQAELADAYSALADVIPQMDYDAVEMILSELSEYKLPEDDAKKMAEMAKLLKKFDWDAMEALLKG